MPGHYDEISMAMARAREKRLARRYFVRGRVQGVGYRCFVQAAAQELGLTGYAKNLEDGRVEVYAAGSEQALSELSGLLWKGPRWADVRGVEQEESPIIHYVGFQIR